MRNMFGEASDFTQSSVPYQRFMQTCMAAKGYQFADANNEGCWHRSSVTKELNMGVDFPSCYNRKWW